MLRKIVPDIVSCNPDSPNYDPEFLYEKMNPKLYDCINGIPVKKDNSYCNEKEFQAEILGHSLPRFLSCSKRGMWKLNENITIDDYMDYVFEYRRDSIRRAIDRRRSRKHGLLKSDFNPGHLWRDNRYHRHGERDRDYKKRLLNMVNHKFDKYRKFPFYGKNLTSNKFKKFKNKAGLKFDINSMNTFNNVNSRLGPFLHEDLKVNIAEYLNPKVIKYKELKKKKNETYSENENESDSDAYADSDSDDEDSGSDYDYDNVEIYRDMINQYKLV